MQGGGGIITTRMTILSMHAPSQDWGRTAGMLLGHSFGWHRTLQPCRIRSGVGRTGKEAGGRRRRRGVHMCARGAMARCAEVRQPPGVEDRS